MKKRPSLHFKSINILGTQPSFVPDDITLVVPHTTDVPQEFLHYLVYIPWKDDYWLNVPLEFRSFFEFVLPYLKVRTTDVHTARCLTFLEELLSKFDQVISRRVVGLALILHDVGWSQLSEKEVAASLGVKGLRLSENAMGPKLKHAQEGVIIARRILEDFQFDPKLTDYEKQLICDAVLYHDQPEKVNRNGQMPYEIRLVVDLDHLWSFTYENFWQDTVRKQVPANDYIINLENDLESYFITRQGKKRAYQLLEERKKEVASWLSYLREVEKEKNNQII